MAETWDDLGIPLLDLCPLLAAVPSAFNGDLRHVALWRYEQYNRGSAKAVTD